MAVNDIPIARKKLSPKVVFVFLMVDYTRVCVKLLLHRDGVDVEMQAQLVKIFAAEY